MSGGDFMGPLTALYEAYIAKADQLAREAKPGAGWFGLPGGPKSDPCHEQFARDAQELFASMAAQRPASAQARQALEYIFRAPEENRNDQSLYWMMQAVHGYTPPLAACLSPEDARVLREAYAKQYRRWERLPAQKKALAALEQAERG